MITHRPYQEKAISLLREGFKIHQRQVLALHTGSGKTVIFANMVAAAYAKEVEWQRRSLQSIVDRSIAIPHLLKIKDPKYKLPLDLLKLVLEFI